MMGGDGGVGSVDEIKYVVKFLSDVSSRANNLGHGYGIIRYIYLIGGDVTTLVVDRSDVL